MKISNMKKIVLIFLTVSVLVVAMSLDVFAATNVWDKASSILKDVYLRVAGISTVAAVAMVAVALLIQNFSKNGKAVDESRTWVKNIIIGWAIINGMSFILSWIVPLLQGGTSISF